MLFKTTSPLCSHLRAIWSLRSVLLWAITATSQFSSLQSIATLAWPRKCLLHHLCLCWINDFYEDNHTLELPFNLHKKPRKHNLEQKICIQMQRGVFRNAFFKGTESGGSCGAHMEPVYCYNVAFLLHRMVCTPYSLTRTMSTNMWFSMTLNCFLGE